MEIGASAGSSPVTPASPLSSTCDNLCRVVTLSLPIRHFQSSRQILPAGISGTLTSNWERGMQSVEH